MTRKYGRTSKELRDALNLAHSMLWTIEHGGSFTTEAFYDRMGEIEHVLGHETWRAQLFVRDRMMRQD